MSLSKLMQLVSPPKEPVEAGSRKDWAAIQKKLGIQLPEDYFDYGATYGSGTMCNGFFRIFNWGSPHYLAYVTAEAEGMRASFDSTPDRVAIYPTLPGLLPWGRDENGTSLCWSAEGSPDKWSVVIQSKAGKQFTYDMTMSEFLASVFANRTRCPVWHEPFASDELDFSPG